MFGMIFHSLAIQGASPTDAISSPVRMFTNISVILIRMPMTAMGPRNARSRWWLQRLVDFTVSWHALQTASVASVMSGVLRRKLMPIFAMGLESVVTRVTTLLRHVLKVVFLRSGEKMRGIHAQRNVAGVAEKHSFGDEPTSELPSVAMSEFASLLPRVRKHPVTFVVLRTRPEPAFVGTGLLHSRPKPFRRLLERHPFILSNIVRLDQQKRAAYKRSLPC